jgi:hypothetical protein
MGKDLYENSAVAKELFEKANEILGFRITDIMFEGTAEELKETKDSFKPIEQKFAESVDKLNSTITELQAKITEQEKQIMQFEKESAIRKEQELAMKADTIWNEALSKSNVPAHLFTKVKKHVVYKDHLKDGALDKSAFQKSIQEEIKDWEDGGVTSTVIGGAFGKPKDVENKDKLSAVKADEEMTNTLLKLVGK